MTISKSVTSQLKHEAIAMIVHIIYFGLQIGACCCCRFCRWHLKCKKLYLTKFPDSESKI